MEVGHQVRCQIDGRDRDKEIFFFSARVAHTVKVMTPIPCKVVKGEEGKQASRAEVSPRIPVLKPDLCPGFGAVISVSLLLGLLVKDKIE